MLWRPEESLSSSYLLHPQARDLGRPQTPSWVYRIPCPYYRPVAASEYGEARLKWDRQFSNVDWYRFCDRGSASGGNTDPYAWFGRNSECVEAHVGDVADKHRSAIKDI